MILESEKMHPIFFLSFDEMNAEENWSLLRRKAPRAERVHGIPGIGEAHRLCAERSSSPMFYVVDGDNEIADDFDFSFTADSSDLNAVHVWRCRNPVNDLVYGYGAVKLFPKPSLLAASPQVDVASSVAQKYKIMPQIASVTHFNTSAFHAWRSAFRECVKLASALIANQKQTETAERLETWCTAGGDRPYGVSALAGARAGREYGLRNKNDLSALGKINDFFWLKCQFEASNHGK